MLTRSASKKKPESPEKSVKKKEVVAVPDNERDYKVMIPSLIIPNSEGNVRSPCILVNFNMLPEENDSVEVIQEGSKTVFNCGVIVINMLPPDSDKEKQSYKSDTKRKLFCSIPKSNYKTKVIDGRNMSNIESMDENYKAFCPGLTSSVRKCSIQLQLNKLGKRERDSESNSSGASFSNKMSVQCNKSDDMSDTSQELSFYKGVLVNGGYRASDFKKEPVVQIVPVSEEEIKSWSNGLKPSAGLHCSQKEAGSSESEFKKMVQKERLLKILKRTDNLISRQRAEKRKNSSLVLRKSLKSVPHDGGQSCDKNFSHNGKKTAKTRRDFDINRVFGDLKTKLEALSEIDERFIEKFLEKYVSYQDSICTEVFEDESMEQHVTLSPVRDVSSLGGEGICSNVNPTSTTQSLESFLMDDEITNILGSLFPEDRMSANEEDPGRVREKSSSDSMQRIVQHTDEDDRRNNSEFANENQNMRQLPSAKKKKENDSLRDIRTSKKKLKKTVTGDARLKNSKMYRDRQTLLSIQLECIKKEIQSRAQVESSSSKKLKPSRKSEKQSDDDVTDFGTARRTRRSVRVQEEVESKATPRTRNTPKTRSKGPMDEYVTVTPRSTRAKSLRREVTEVMERKRRLEDLMETPKMSKTPKKGSPTEDEVNVANEKLPSYKLRRSRKPLKENETGDEVVEEEQSTTRKICSPKKISQMEAMEKDGGGETAEVRSSPKWKKSKSPMKSQTEETKDKNEFDEKAMEAVSSPLKKKKEAAERLRAEEEKLGLRKMKEVEVAEMSSPKKNKSPAIPAPEENAETPILSTPKKPTRKLTVARQMFLGETLNTELPSSPKQKETKSPKKHIRDERTTVESEEVTTASPKKLQLQEVTESESVVIDLIGKEAPTRRKSKSPTKTIDLEVLEAEDKVPIEVDLSVMTSPKRQKSKSPQKKQHVKMESVVEIAEVTPPERQRSKSPKKKHVEEREPEEIELNDVELLILSPTREKNTSTKNRQTREDESEGSVVEEYMCVVSPQKQKMMKKPKRRQDVEVFCPDDSESEEVEILSAKQQKTKASSREDQEGKRSDSEGIDVLVKTSPKRQEMISPKKHTQQEDEKRESEKRQKSKSPREKLKEQKMTGSESEEVEESVTSIRQQSHLEEPKNRDSNVEVGSMTSPKRRKRHGVEESVPHTTASPDKQKQEIEVEIEEVAQEGSTHETSFARSKKSKLKKKTTDTVQEYAQMSIPQLGEDFLASIPSQKTSVKVKGEAKINERHKRKNEKKQKLLKRLMKDDGYIPLEVGGPTNFSVVELDKVNTSSRHPAFDLKRHLLYGAGVKRIPYSQVQSYQMKVESRKMRF